MALQFFSDDIGGLKQAVFCFTGRSPKPRHTMTCIALDAGASVTSTVIASTTILVIADANSKSRKAEKAREMGIDLISPDQFFEICEQVKNGDDGFLNNITKSGTDKVLTTIRMTKQKPVIEQEVEKTRHSLVRRIKL